MLWALTALLNLSPYVPTAPVSGSAQFLPSISSSTFKLIAMSFTFIALHYLPHAPWSVELLGLFPDKTIQADMADVSQGATELMRGPFGTQQQPYICLSFRQVTVVCLVNVSPVNGRLRMKPACLRCQVIWLVLKYFCYHFLGQAPMRLYCGKKL